MWAVFLIGVSGCGSGKSAGSSSAGQQNSERKRELTKINLGASQNANTVMSLVKGKNQNNQPGLFIGTMEGVYFYSFSSKNIVQIVDAESKLKTEKIYSICQEDGGKLWFGAESGVYSYNFNSVRLFDIGKTSALVQSNSGMIWAGTQYGLALYDGSKSFNKFTRKSDNLPNDDLLCFGIDTKETTFYAGTRQGAIVVGGPGNFSTKSGTSMKPTPSGDLIEEPGNTEMAGNSIYAIAMNSNGVMYIGTNMGVNRCKNFSNWSVFSADSEVPAKTASGLGYKKVKGNSPLISNWIKSIYIDEADSLWIATTKGMSYFNGDNKWENYTMSEGLASNTVNAVTGEKTAIFIATAGGLNVLDYPEVKAEPKGK
jgi:ligand-binding sensor domain-containing protein